MHFPLYLVSLFYAFNTWWNDIKGIVHIRNFNPINRLLSPGYCFKQYKFLIWEKKFSSYWPIGNIMYVVCFLIECSIKKLVLDVLVENKDLMCVFFVNFPRISWKPNGPKFTSTNLKISYRLFRCGIALAITCFISCRVDLRVEPKVPLSRKETKRVK